MITLFHYNNVTTCVYIIIQKCILNNAVTAGRKSVMFYFFVFIAIYEESNSIKLRIEVSPARIQNFISVMWGGELIKIYTHIYKS